MLARKTREAADEIKSPLFQLLTPVVRELADHLLFAREDFRTDRADVLGAEPEFARPPQGHEAVGRLDEGLARHAAAQNAQAADLLAALDERGLQAEAGGGARRGVARAATADDDEIVGGNFRIGRGGIFHVGGGSKADRTS